MPTEQPQKLIDAITGLGQPGWVELTTLVVGALGLLAVVVAFYGLRATYQQMSRDWKWQKTTLQNQKLFEGVDIQVELAIAEILTALHLKPYEPIPKGRCEEIYNDHRKWVPIKHFLNHYETLCVAMSAGIVDEELAYNLHSSRVVILWKQWNELCKHVRQQQEDPEIYWELEKWAGEFLNEQSKREKAEELSRKQVEKQIAEGKGMKEVIEDRHYGKGS